MNCQETRDHLLRCERPDRPGPAPSAHLVGCDPCRAWLRRLVRMEKAVARLPVDVPPVPAELFAALEPAPLVRPRLHQPEGRRDWGRRKVALVSSLAAALLLFALGLWAWSWLGGNRDALAEYHTRRDAVIAAVRGPAERVRALVGLGDRLLDEALADAGSAEAKAAHFAALALTDLPGYAGDIPADARGAAVKAALEDLGRTESRAARLAVEQAEPRLRRALARIAACAREADRRLRPLAA